MDLSEREQDSMERLGITIDPYTVRAVSKSSQYETGIMVQTDAREIDYEACFTGPDFMPNDGLLRDAGCAVDGGWVITEAGKTSQNGLWAAGNVVSSPDQIPQAMGAGAAVAIKIDQYMFDEDRPVID
ncbi:FAD-dependent oxidoreductase [Corynebacterium propinquum]|nr:FAD-dependent oxidoreductase [Corynebacterium propinquum]MDK4251799.1 FAD-dependent oxidoreductase [Corynebacterium propinquum]